jgi:hypothetical protein
MTWLCFFPSSEQKIAASKDGSMGMWNINDSEVVAVQSKVLGACRHVMSL